MRNLFRIMFCLAPFVGVCFSLDTNPLSAYQATDSSVFIYMGRSILDGLTPYRDVFDHKGLFLYFLNAAGLWLGDIMGLWLIECLFIFGSIAYAGVYLSRRFGFAAAWMGMLVCGAAFSFVMGGGNLAESYACGLSVFSLASLCRDVDYGGIRKRSCFVHGACAVLLLLLRPNLAVAPVVVAIAYCICACRERSFRRLLIWSGCSLLAAFIVFAPFGLYLNAHDLWRDCFDAYIRFNLSYAGIATGRHPLLWVCAAILGAAFFCWRKARLTDRDVVGVALLFAIVAFVVLVANPLHGHYYGVFLPALVILVPFFFRNAFCGTRLRMIANGVAILAGIVELAMISAACVSGHYLTDTVHGKRILNPVRYFRYDRGHMQDVDAFESIIDDRNSVTVMGNMCLIYAYLHARTPLRYPYQLPIAKLDKSIMDEVVSDLVGRKSRYIITTKQAWPEKVSKAIANNYRLVRRSGEFSLYLVDRASEVKPHRE